MDHANLGCAIGYAKAFRDRADGLVENATAGFLPFNEIPSRCAGIFQSAARKLIEHLTGHQQGGGEGIRLPLTPVRICFSGSLVVVQKV